MRSFVFILLFYTSLCSALTTKINNDNLEPFVSPEALQQRISDVALQLDNEYKGHPITLVMVMKGAICITADLMRQLNTPVEVEYLKASSYGKNGTKRGALTITGLEDLNIQGKHVLLVDDVLDSGETLRTIKEKLEEKNPKSLKSLVVFQKKIPRSTHYRADYVLFEMDNEFIVGYGLDYKERFRELPGIFILKNPDLVIS